MTSDPTRTSEVEGKLEAVRALLFDRGWSGVVFESQSSWAWITAGGRSHISLGEETGIASVLVTEDDAYVLTTNIERMRLIDEEIAELPFETLEYPWHRPDDSSRIIGRLCDPRRTVSDLGGTGTRSASELQRLRLSLVTGEVERYRSLGRDAADAVEIACGAAEAGDAELDVAARLAHECVARDILPIVDLVAADDRIGRYRHPLPTTNRLRRSLLVALTGRRQGLHASLTRMVSLGEPDDDLTARHAAVVEVDAAVILDSRPGRSLGEAFGALMDMYESKGFAGEWQLHHQGGVTGYAGREIFATPDNHHRLRTGEVVAWNPSITKVKSEDTVFIGTQSNEVLTRTGNWPEVEVEVGAQAMARHALLVK